MYFNYVSKKFCRLQGADAPSAGNAPPLTLADMRFASVDTAERAFNSDLKNPEAHLLIDIGPGDVPASTTLTLPESKAYVVAVGSPSACSSNIVQSWVSKQVGLITRYLPVVPLAVLEECRRLICPTLAEEAADRALPADHPRALLSGERYRANVDKDEFDERFLRFGGIPRSCIDSPDSEVDSRFKTVLANCTLKQIVNGTSDGTLNELHKYSSMLLHYRVFDSEPLTPAERQAVYQARMAATGRIKDATACADALPAPRPEALPFCLLSPSLQLASGWVRDQLYEKYQGEHQHAVSEFLHECVLNPSLFLVRHEFFESHAHSVMRRGGLTLYTQQLDQNNGGRIGGVVQKLFNASGATHPHLTAH